MPSLSGSPYSVRAPGNVETSSPVDVSHEFGRLLSLASAGSAGKQERRDTGMSAGVLAPGGVQAMEMWPLPMEFITCASM